MYTSQNETDILHFYHALFINLAIKYKLNREDFRKLVETTYHNLPIRADRLDEYWENICKAHGINIQYDNENFSEITLKKLADTIWLPIDQQSENGKQQQEELDKL